MKCKWKRRSILLKEALRVVKKGGAFSFQDMFSQKALYGDMDEFVRILKAEGISEVHYIGNLEKKLEFIPGFVTTPWMIREWEFCMEKNKPATEYKCRKGRFVLK